MKKLKEHKLPFDSFIGGWYIPKKITKSLVKFYDDNPNFYHRGVSYTVEGEVNYKNKKSTDMIVKPFTNHPLFQPYEEHVVQCVKNYSKRYKACDQMEPYGLYIPYNVQKYKPGEGFYSYHYERTGEKTWGRHLVFMTYLNDVPNGGTDFKYQKLKSPAKEGLTLIWPADWTHTHKGVISNKHEKYIATGWIVYKSSIGKSD